MRKPIFQSRVSLNIKLSVFMIASPSNTWKIFQSSGSFHGGKISICRKSAWKLQQAWGHLHYESSWAASFFTTKEVTKCLPGTNVPVVSGSWPLEFLSLFWLTFFDACKLVESATVTQWMYLNLNTNIVQLNQSQVWSEQRNIKQQRKILNGKVNQCSNGKHGK